MGRISFEDVYSIYLEGGREAVRSLSLHDDRFIPTSSGVYIVRPPKDYQIEFVKNPDGTRSVDGKPLLNEFDFVTKKYTELVDKNADLSVLYYGRATNLRNRIKQYAKFGYAYKDRNGRPFEEHAGGKLIWYIKNNKHLIIDFYEIKDFKMEEERLIREYYKKYGEFPLANERF